jgi:hypothetical protein
MFSSLKFLKALVQTVASPKKSSTTSYQQTPQLKKLHSKRQNVARGMLSVQHNTDNLRRLYLYEISMTLWM